MGGFRDLFAWLLHWWSSPGVGSPPEVNDTLNFLYTQRDHPEFAFTHLDVFDAPYTISDTVNYV